MDVILIKALQLILAFAILVIIHEFGHFLFARLFGVKVERFYIFFNPWFSIFKWKPKKYKAAFSKNTPFDSEIATQEAKNIEVKDAEEVDETAPKPSEEIKKAEEKEEPAEKEGKKKKKFWSDTEYGIGWLPLGGYCKIAGMVDESMDLEQLKKDPEPWEFRSKPAWQRLLIMIAGVLFNFLLAILIYAGIVYATGEQYVRFKDAKMGMVYSPAAKNIGFQDGDIPLTADGKDLENVNDARMEMIQAKVVSVLRDGKDTVDIAIPEKFIFALDKEAKTDSNLMFSFMAYRIPAMVNQVVAGEGAQKAGIKEKDIILSVDTIQTPDVFTFLQALPGKKDQTLDFTILRKEGAKEDTLKIPVKLNANSKIGVGLELDPTKFFPTQVISYNMVQAVPRGVQMGTEKMTSYVKSMKQVFTKEGAQSVGGFGAIGSIFPEKWDWIAFWNIAAFLSVALAFMNILPIPGLDGGHVMFLLYEVIFRRPPNQKFMERATMVGLILLLLLLIYANGMDIVRLFK